MSGAREPKFCFGLSEVALGVESVSASVRFYTEVVGLVPEKVEEQAAILWAGQPGEQRRLILLSRALAPLARRDRSGVTGRPAEDSSPISSFSPKDIGRAHFAFLVPNDRLDEAVAHVREQGVDIWGPVDFELARATAYYFLDPDSNLVEFWSPGETQAAGPQATGG